MDESAKLLIRILLVVKDRRLSINDIMLELQDSEENVCDQARVELILQDLVDMGFFLNSDQEFHFADLRPVMNRQTLKHEIIESLVGSLSGSTFSELVNFLATVFRYEDVIHLLADYREALRCLRHGGFVIYVDGRYYIKADLFPSARNPR